jgi:putative MATE family efflux protein
MNKLTAQSGLYRNVLDTDRIGWLLVKMSMPVFLGQLVQTLYNVVNTIFIGHIQSGTMAIAGLSIVFPIQMIMMGMGMMVGIGGTSVISRAIGSKDIPRAERTLGNGLTSILVISAIVTAGFLIWINPILRMVGASDEVLPFARDYLVIILAGNIINTTGIVLLNYARAEGNTRIGMISQITAALLNIALDAVFILGFKMGVRGAALGTVIAQTAALLILSSYYISGKSYLKLHVFNMRPDSQIIKPIFTVGISGFVQTTASSLSSILVLNSIVSYGGDIALSAFGIAQRIMFFMIIPGLVIGQGVQPIIGFNYGAKRYSLSLKALKYAAVSSTILSVMVFILVYLLPQPIIRIFTSDPALVSSGIYACKRIFLGVPLMGFVMLGSGSFQSIGRALQAFILALARPAIFMIPAVLILPRFLGLSGVLLTLPVADFLTFVLSIILLYPVIRNFQKAARTAR